MAYLWQHGIDELQDATIEAAIVCLRKETGAIVNRNTMLKIIIMKYGEGLESYPLSSAPLEGRNSGDVRGKERTKG